MKPLATVVGGLLLMGAAGPCARPHSSASSSSPTGQNNAACPVAHCYKSIATLGTGDHALAVNTSSLFWTDQGKMVAVPKSGGTPSTLGAANPRSSS
jgi:hypothetical protein